MSFFADYGSRIFKRRLDLPYLAGFTVAVVSYILTGSLFFANNQHFDHLTVRLGYAALLILITLSWIVPV
ncbi:MAG: hypothetical protein ACR2PH_06715, partial [Desulfobulbia bacterium]